MSNDQITFHEAWGHAKDRSDYNKEAWNAKLSMYTGPTGMRFTFATWSELIYGKTPAPIDAAESAPTVVVD